MIRRSQLLALGTVGLLSLVGCSSPEQATNPSVVDSTQQASTDAANSAADAAQDAAGAANTAADAAQDAAGAANGAAMAPMTGGAEELTAVVTNTRTAVEAGDFAKAQEEFAKFGDSWSKFGEGVKATSSEGYTAIETNVGNINAALGEAQPDKTKVMDALTALSASIDTFVKS